MHKGRANLMALAVLLACFLLLASSEAVTAQHIPSSGTTSRQTGGREIQQGQGITGWQPAPRQGGEPGQTGERVGVSQQK